MASPMSRAVKRMTTSAATNLASEPGGSAAAQAGKALAQKHAAPMSHADRRFASAPRSRWPCGRLTMRLRRRLSRKKRDGDERDDDERDADDDDVADVMASDALPSLGGLENGSFVHGKLLARNWRLALCKNALEVRPVPYHGENGFAMRDRRAREAQRRLLRKIDQRDAELRPLSAPEGARRLLQHDFKRRPDDRLKQMAAAGRPVAKPEHGVNMEARLAAIVDRNIADQAERFALLGDLDLSIVLRRGIEPADR